MPNFNAKGRERERDREISFKKRRKSWEERVFRGRQQRRGKKSRLDMRMAVCGENQRDKNGHAKLTLKFS